MDEVEPVRGSVDALLTQGIKALEAQDWERAAAKFGEIVARRPDRPEGHLGLARLALHLGRPADALRHLPEALRADPSSFDAYETMAFLGIFGGVADTAIEWLERGAQHLPREPRLFEYLVRLYAMEGRAEDLRECLAYYGRLRGLGLRQAAMIFTREAGIPEDLKSRIAVAAGF